MNTRTLATVGLLLFVVAAVVAVIVRDRGAQTPAQPEPSASTYEGPRLVTWYLHGDKRCVTCRKIEATARSALDKGFADDLASGRLVWRVSNYDKPENEHLMDDYEIASSSVVLVRENQGKVERWENLDRVWELVDDTPAFEDYVASRVRAFIESGQ